MADITHVMLTLETRRQEAESALEAERRFSRVAINVIESIARELGVPTNDAPAEGFRSVLDECTDAIRKLKAAAKVTP